MKTLFAAPCLLLVVAASVACGGAKSPDANTAPAQSTPMDTESTTTDAPAGAAGTSSSVAPENTQPAK